MAMTNKANIILDDELYEWLEEVRSRTRARSVPDVIRTILTTIREAAAHPTSAGSRIMGDVIYSLTPPELKGFGVPPGEAAPWTEQR